MEIFKRRARLRPASNTSWSQKRAGLKISIGVKTGWILRSSITPREVFEKAMVNLHNEQKFDVSYHF